MSTILLYENMEFIGATWMWGEKYRKKRKKSKPPSLYSAGLYQKGPQVKFQLPSRTEYLVSAFVNTYHRVGRQKLPSFFPYKDPAGSKGGI